MRKLGILSLTLFAALTLGTDAFAQRGGGSSGGGGGGSRGSSGSSGMSRGGGSSGGSSGMSRGSSGGSSSRASSGGGGSSRSSGAPSSSSRSSSSSGSRSYDAPSYGGPSRSSGSSSGSRSSGDRYDYDAPVYRSSSGNSGDRGESGSGSGEGTSTLEPSAIVNRYTNAPRSNAPMDIDSAERVRFPAPYRSGTSGRPAVPSYTGSGRGSTSPELRGLVDRYRGASRGSDFDQDSRSSVSPTLDRYGRSGSSGQRAAAPGRGAPSLGLDSERYTRGPKLRRSPSGSSVSRAAPGTIARLSDRQGQGDGLARPPSGGGRNAGSPAAAASDARAHDARARGLTRLATKDPQAARRIAAAGDVLANAASAGMAVGAGAVAGPAAAGAVRGATRGSSSSSSSESCYWWGWSDCSDDFCWGFSFSFGCGWGSCWPWWSFGWWPYYCYGYNYCYPYYCYPYSYYPYYYSSVVYPYYDDDYDDDGDVIVYADGDDGYAEAPPAEPVGEAAAGERKPDSKVRTSLSIAAERYLTLGDSAFREGRFGDAAQFYAKAAEYAPDEGVLHLVLADALFATGDYHYAAYAIRRAFELDPTLADAVVDKHEFYTDPADFDRHIARAEIFLRENPDDSDARLVLAANYLFGNRPASAVDVLETVSALSLRADTAATAILGAARAAQHGEPAPVEKP